MPIYKIDSNKIIELSHTTFASERIDEARELQKLVINSIEIIDPGLYVLTCEFGDWQDSKRRIDILCIDKAANLVVVELKRTEDGGHMELQAIRYAAMVSGMTFEKAVRAHEAYLRKNGLQTDPEEEILNFLEWDDVNEEDFANDTRIILVSADFSIEITTSVLWLLERDIDIKCIRIKPQKDGQSLYFDIQQIIPLPESSDYQVKLREKVTEQRQSRRTGERDYSHYNVKLNGKEGLDLNKRQTMHFVISESVKAGIRPEELMKITGAKRWIWVNKICQTKQDFEMEQIQNIKRYDPTRWFNSEEELLHFDGKTYAFSNQHGKGTFEMTKEIFKHYPNLMGEIHKAN